MPKSFHFLARQAKRVLTIDARGDQLSIGTATSMAGRAIDETSVKFRVGLPFSGEQKLGGAFIGRASWAASNGHAAEHAGAQDRVLVVEKEFSVEGHRVVLEERFSLADGRLQVVTACNGLAALGKTKGLPEAAGSLQSTMWFDRSGGGDSASATAASPVVTNKLQLDVAPLLAGARVQRKRPHCFSNALAAIMSRIFHCMACTACAGRRPVGPAISGGPPQPGADGEDQPKPTKDA